jgi:hypothetical protein
VPAKQSFGFDEEPHATAPFKEPTQPGKQGSIRRPQGWAVHLTTEHGNLVSEHDDFNDQFTVVASAEAQQLEDSGEGKVDNRQGHGPVSSSGATQESPVQTTRMTFSGTVALRANDAEPASIGAMAERQSRDAQVFTMHLNTRFSAHLMLRVGPRGSMQQCLGRAWSWVHVAPDRCRSGWMMLASREPWSGAGMFERFVSRRALPVPLSLPRASQ